MTKLNRPRLKPAKDGMASISSGSLKGSVVRYSNMDSILSQSLVGTRRLVSGLGIQRRGHIDAVK
jgi:hypothetical protein